MSEYELLKNLTEVGIKLGYAGEETSYICSKSTRRGTVKSASVFVRKSNKKLNVSREKQKLLGSMS